MPSRFELFVARRYLRAKRKQAVIGVITVLSVLGVAAGVMALIIALAVNNGFRNTLQRNLLGATAHVNVMERTPGFGIENWRELANRFRTLPGVISVAPGLYGGVYISGERRGTGAVLKGVILDPPPDFARHIKEGSLEGLRPSAPSAPEERVYPGLIVGRRLADETGIKLNSIVRVITEQGEIRPLGVVPSWRYFRVAGIYDSGFFDLDSAWVFTSLDSAQKLLSLGDVVNSIELRVQDIYDAPRIATMAEEIGGAGLGATHWMELNRQILSALRMERVVTVITIGLIQLVAALNIFIALVMMVMEKHRDIAILMSLGARVGHIRRIFIYQGVMIGVVGAAIGMIAGYSLCFLADHYRWIELDPSVYSLAFVPFEPRPLDALWISAGALLVSFTATIYPARNATQIVPVEALRYE